MWSSVAMTWLDLAVTNLAWLLLNWEVEWPLSQVVGANSDLEWPDYDLSCDTNTNVVIQHQVDAKLTCAAV